MLKQMGFSCLNQTRTDLLSRNGLFLLQRAQAWVRGGICHLHKPTSLQPGWWAPNLAETAWGSVAELEKVGHVSAV